MSHFFLLLRVFFTSSRNTTTPEIRKKKTTRRKDIAIFSALSPIQSQWIQFKSRVCVQKFAGCVALVPKRFVAVLRWRVSMASRLFRDGENFQWKSVFPAEVVVRKATKTSFHAFIDSFAVPLCRLRHIQENPTSGVGRKNANRMLKKWMLQRIFYFSFCVWVSL